MKNNLIIIGASGHGKVVAEIAELSKNYKNIFFMDDFNLSKKFNGYVNLGSAKNIHKFKSDADVFVAIGNNEIRKQKLNNLISENFSIPTLIHPKAIVSDTVIIGSGSVIMAGAVINPYVRIGIGTIVNTKSSIDHDTIIGDYAHLSPGTTVAGTVQLGNSVWLGTGATVINNLKIGNNIVIGAGAVVLSNLKMAGTYVGIPATNVKEKR